MLKSPFVKKALLVVAILLAVCVLLFTLFSWQWQSYVNAG